MNTRFASVLLALSLAVSACAVSPEVSGSLPMPPVKILQKSYSFLPPAQPGWFLVQRDAYAVQLLRRTDSFGGTGSIHATLFELNYDGSSQGLLDLVSARNSAKANNVRFKQQNADHSIVVHDGQTCVRAEVLTIDKQARTPDGGTTPMLLNIVQLICPLPESPAIGLSFTYSLRYRALKPQTAIRVEAKKLMESIRFSGDSKPRIDA